MSNTFGTPYTEFDLIELPLISLRPKVVDGEYSNPFDENGNVNEMNIQSNDDLINTGMKNLIRTDTLKSVGVVSNSYNTISHKTIVENIYRIIDDECEEINHGKSNLILNPSGSKLWMHIVLENNKYEISEHDQIAKQVIVKHATDGTSSLWIWIGAYTFVCSNLTLIGETFSRVSITHNREVDFTEVQNQLSLGLNGFEEKIEQLQPLKDIKIPEDEASIWIDTMLKRNKHELKQLESNHKFSMPKSHIQSIGVMWSTKEELGTINRQGNNLLSLLNTATEYYTHLKSISPDVRFKYIRHATARVLDLKDNFDEEMNLALDLS